MYIHVSLILAVFLGEITFCLISWKLQHNNVSFTALAATRSKVDIREKVEQSGGGFQHFRLYGAL